jgi:hypothetical protein
MFPHVYMRCMSSTSNTSQQSFLCVSGLCLFALLPLLMDIWPVIHDYLYRFVTPVGGIHSPPAIIILFPQSSLYVPVQLPWPRIEG